MEFANLTPISAQKSVRAINSSVESLSENSTPTVKFLYNSVKKFFAKVSFPAKNSKSAARKGEETRPFDFVQKKLAKSSFRFNFFANNSWRSFSIRYKKMTVCVGEPAIYIVKHGERTEKFYCTLSVSNKK